MKEDIQQDLALLALENYFQTKSPGALVKFWELYPRPIPSWHLNMMNDKTRNDFYQKEISSSVRDKIVLDVGAGSGLLTQFALEAGARHIYALEQDPVLQKCFEFAFKNEIQTGRITLLPKSSKELQQPDFKQGAPEVVMHEIFGQALFNEKVMETFFDLFTRKILDDEMEFIPQKFSLWGRLHQQAFDSKIKDPRYTDKFWFLEDISYFGTPLKNKKEEDEGIDVSEGFEIFKLDLKDLKERMDNELTVQASSAGNFLRVWFELYGKHSTLTTDTQRNPENHWGNSKYFLRFPQGQITLRSSYSAGKFLSYVKR